MNRPLPHSPVPATPPAAPWWRTPTMWLVVGGPAAVVVASFITLAVAIEHRDEVLPDSADARSAESALQAQHPAAAPRR
jgi:hypothetical protein